MSTHYYHPDGCLRAKNPVNVGTARAEHDCVGGLKIVKDCVLGLGTQLNGPLCRQPLRDGRSG
jgi:hypothetical protein